MALKLNSSTNDFLEVVIDPFGSKKPAQVPDLCQLNSLCLTDYYELTSANNYSAVAISGALFWVDLHYTTFKNSSSNHNGLVYSLNYAPILSTGLLQLSAGNQYASLGTQNQATIIGSQFSIATITALITSLRLMSMGLKVLPTIEQVTNTTVNYITYAIGGQLSMQELGNAYTNGSNIYDLIKNSPCAQVFGNNEGVCVRYDPFQNEQQLNMINLVQANNVSLVWDWYKLPCIAVNFSQSIAASGAMPVIVHSQFWLEACLKQPTPIYSQQSPVDPNYPMIRSIMSGCTAAAPLVTKGHSFPTLTSILPLISKFGAALLRGASDVLDPNASMANINRKRRARTNNNNRFVGSKAPFKATGPVRNIPLKSVNNNKRNNNKRRNNIKRRGNRNNRM